MKPPLAFRAQIEGRCQPQYPQTKDAERWVDEWVTNLDKTPYAWPRQQTAQLQTQQYQFDWRLVTNGGQDDGIIRPVIGSRGLPYYPGSSMKGAFRHACNLAQTARYCGRDDQSPAEIPLRFLGGYVQNEDWHEKLLDLTHPQQKWQVQTSETQAKEAGESAFAMLSLHQPQITFAIAAVQGLSEEQWQEIWQIWERAIAQGLGCRVSAGYGQVSRTAKGKSLRPKTGFLYRCHLQGEGCASQLLDQTPVFRPNIFRAALRGHALRLFGGLTTADNAKRLVHQLFGGTVGGTVVGLLRCHWENTAEPKFIQMRQKMGRPTAYEVEGQLRWYLTHAMTHSLDNEPLSPEQQENHLKSLKVLIRGLTRFAMLLGGFGKGWRRPDHTLFYRDDYRQLIGCHWDWAGDSVQKDTMVVNLQKVATFIDQRRKEVMAWMRLQGIEPNPSEVALWRESWHPDRVQVWGRPFSEDINEMWIRRQGGSLASDIEQPIAIDWLHENYHKGQTIKRSDLTGSINQVGRLWYRIYPVVIKRKVEGQWVSEETNHYWELLTLFPDRSDGSTRQFLEFLATSSSHGFMKLWGN